MRWMAALIFLLITRTHAAPASSCSEVRKLQTTYEDTVHESLEFNRKVGKSPTRDQQSKDCGYEKTLLDLMHKIIKYRKIKCGDDSDFFFFVYPPAETLERTTNYVKAMCSENK